MPGEISGQPNPEWAVIHNDPVENPRRTGAVLRPLTDRSRSILEAMDAPHKDGTIKLDPAYLRGLRPRYPGDVEGANIIKIHRRSGKLSYLVYPGFDNDPHSAILRSIRVNLRTRQIDGTDYAQSTNPPVLHRKDAFLTADHPPRARFARLKSQDEKNGLLDNPSAIGTRNGWARRLADAGTA